MTDHTISLLAQIERFATAANREEIHMCGGLVASILSQHRHEVAVFGVTDDWRERFEKAYDAAKASVDLARASMLTKAAWNAGVVAPGRHFEYPKSRADARRIVMSAFDHGGRSIEGPTRLAIDGRVAGQASIRWADEEGRRLVISAAGQADMLILTDDIIAAATMGGIALVVKTPGMLRLIEVARLAEAV